MTETPRSTLQTSSEVSFSDYTSTAPESILANRLAAAWQAGERLTAEEVLACCNVNDINAQTAVRVIFEEICQRQDAGEEIQSGEYFQRFPQWRSELARLFECQGLLEDRPPKFPEVGETFHGFALEAELGRGAQGRVYLVTQSDLAHRQVVLKFSPRWGEEHLSLARVQHTNIVPIYFAHEHIPQNLRVFCMPYLGGATLAHINSGLRPVPVERRTGQELAAILLQSVPVAGQRGAANVEQLLQADYVTAVCTLGAQLADGLQYVHERGLTHLDIKPSNVLVTADGQPMLLDFHLAREPVLPGGPWPAWFGGTPDYMPPEQRRVMEAIRKRQPITEPVDGRADIYSLGLVLYETLSGVGPLPGGAELPPLIETRPGISLGLSDILSRAMAAEPARRYQTAGALAADLRRHLEHRPLQGVANRSLTERWKKWRRRRPAALSVLALFALIVLSAVGAGTVAARFVQQQWQGSQEALVTGERLAAQGHYAAAAEQFDRGLRAAHQLPLTTDLIPALEAAQAAVRAQQKVAKLHDLVEQLRFLYSQDRSDSGGPTLVSDEPSSSSTVQAWEASCETVWKTRDAVLATVANDPPLAEAARTDLADLAVLWADFTGRATVAGHRRAMRILDEAAGVLGANPILNRERSRHARGAQISIPPGDDNYVKSQLQTAWDYYAFGRALMRERRLDEANRSLEQAVELDPHNFWINFYQAECAYRRSDWNSALQGLRVCVSLAPDKAECYYNRGLVRAARHDWEGACRDFDQALKLAPKLTLALVERGKTRSAQGRHREALTDLQLALKQGADPASTYYEMAEVQLAQQDRAAAITSLNASLARNPAFAPAKTKLARLLQNRM